MGSKDLAAIIRPAAACCLLVLGLARFETAAASDDATRCELDIARQPLGGALQRLAEQCGLQIIFFSSMTEGLAAPAITGKHTLTAALDKMLEGSDLTYRVLNPRTVEVRSRRSSPETRSARQPSREATPPDASSSPPGAPRSDVVDEVVVVGVAEQLVATRVATPLRDIPQSVSIVTRKQLEQQNSTDLADVLRRSPGITVSRNTTLDVSYYARGYQITQYHIDGGAAIDSQLEGFLVFLGPPDLSEFDHVEVLRGSDGLFGGNATPGGTVSLVRKRAQRNFAATANVTAGSWDRSRSELDVTGPLALDGAIRGRADAVYSREDYFSGVGPNERKKIFATAEYDLTLRSTLTLGGSYQWDDAQVSASAIPFRIDGRKQDLSRDTNLSFDWNRYRSRLGEVYLQFGQELGDEWALKINASGSRARLEYAYGYFLGPAGFFGNPGMERPSADYTGSPNVFEQLSADVTLAGTFDWFGSRNEFAVGADYTRFDTTLDKFSIANFGVRLDDIPAFDPRDYPNPLGVEEPNQFTTGTRGQILNGVFASLRTYLGDAWSVTAGARLSGAKETWDVLTRYPDFGDYSAKTSESIYHVLTPYAGVMYRLSRDYTVYASYSDIYERVGMHERPSGKRLGPVHGVNMEVGIKGAWRDGALNGSLVVYRTERRNIPSGVPNDPDDPNESPYCCSRGVTSRSRGVDLGLEGDPAPGWTLGAGYAYNTNRSELGGALSEQTPRHLFKAWTSLRLPGEARHWRLGASLQAQSSLTTSIGLCFADGCSESHGSQASYAVLDLSAGYEVNDAWRMTLGLNNVFDKTYFETVGSPNMHAWYGEPRNWMLRVDGRY